MALERTLVLIKPHAVAERWANPIYQRYVEAGLMLADMQALTLTRDEAAAFYAEHEGKDFFDRLLDAMCSGPTVTLIWLGDNAIEWVRELNGETNPDKAEPGTIRHDFKGSGGPFNTVHGSDSTEAVFRETSIIFGS